MSEWEKRIENLADAEAYFRAMGCQHFHMHREYPERYDEYRALHVSKQTELSWIGDEFNNQARAIMKGDVEASDLWWRHSRLAELSLLVGDVDAWRRLLEVTRQIATLVPNEDRVMVAETLVGRAVECADSPVCRCQALGQEKLAHEFLELVPTFCDGTLAPEGGRAIEDRRASVLRQVQFIRERILKED